MAEQIIDKIIEYMKCISCNEYLCPPISYHLNGTFTCKNCIETELEVSKTSEETSTLNKCSDVMPCLLLENIGNLLKFPCRFKAFGCELKISWEKRDDHANDCPFRQFKCPICMDVIGSAKDMYIHAKRIHRQMIFIRCTKIFLEYERKIMFFINNQELYVLIYECDKTSELLLLTLKSIGPLARADRRHFKLWLKHEEAEFSLRKQVEGGIHWAVDNKTAIKIDLSVLKKKLNLKDENVIDLFVDVHSRIPLYHGNFINELLEEIECHYCHEYMYLPIEQCSTGHSFCGRCKLMIKSCPFCSSPMSNSRNFMAEKISTQMHCNCMYADDGCQFVLPIKDIVAHESVCEYSLYDCPFKSFIEVCKWRGKLDELSSHTFEEHDTKF